MKRDGVANGQQARRQPVFVDVRRGGHGQNVKAKRQNARRPQVHVSDSAAIPAPSAAEDHLGDLLLEVLPPDGSTMGNVSAREALSRAAPHSRAFWLLVERNCPAFALNRLWLKEQALRLL